MYYIYIRSRHIAVRNCSWSLSALAKDIEGNIQSRTLTLQITSLYCRYILLITVNFHTWSESEAIMQITFVLEIPENGCCFQPGVTISQTETETDVCFLFVKWKTERVMIISNLKYFFV